MNPSKQINSKTTFTLFDGTVKPHYFLAAYVRIKVLNISKISYREMTAQLNCQIFIDISTKGIKTKEINKILEQGFRLSFEANESMLINRMNKDVTIHYHERSERITIIIHKFLQVKLVVRSKYELIWAPFELIVCKLALRIKKLKIIHDPEEIKNEALEESKKLGKALTGNEVFPVQTEYHFNIMDHPDMNMKLIISSNASFGLFKIANNKFHVEYRNGFLDKKEIEMLERVNNEKMLRKIKNLSGEIDRNSENKVSKKILEYVKSELHEEVEKRIDESCETNNNMLSESLVFINDSVSKSKIKRENKSKLRKELGDKLIIEKYKQISQMKEVEEDERKNLLQKPEKIQSFNVAIFEIPIYKIPLVPTLTIALPIFFLSIINLGVFYQKPNLKDRIVSISLLLISFVALIPTIREQIPPTPVYTILEVIVFAEALTTMLALIESFDVSGSVDENGPPYVFTMSNPYFIVCIIITAISIIIVVMMSLAYVCLWRKSYNKVDDFPQTVLNQSIKNDEWKNKECDDYFKQILSKS